MSRSGGGEDVMALLRAALQTRDRLDLQDAIYHAENANKATAGYNLRLCKEMLDLVNQELEMRTLLLDAMTARVRAPLEDTVRRCEQSLGEWAGHAEEAVVAARALVARLLEEERVANAIRAGIAHWKTLPVNKFDARTMLNKAFYDLEVLEGERCPELLDAVDVGKVAHAQVNAECASVEAMMAALKLFFDDGYQLHVLRAMEDAVGMADKCAGPTGEGMEDPIYDEGKDARAKLRAKRPEYPATLHMTGHAGNGIWNGHYTQVYDFSTVDGVTGRGPEKQWEINGAPVYRKRRKDIENHFSGGPARYMYRTFDKYWVWCEDLSTAVYEEGWYRTDEPNPFPERHIQWVHNYGDKAGTKVFRMLCGNAETNKVLGPRQKAVLDRWTAQMDRLEAMRKQDKM